jgi:flagellar biosynthesis/type III secretory pathway chaperone
MAQENHATVEQLHYLLSDEANGYRELINLTQREHNALKEQNLSELTAVVQSKEKILDRLKQWEQAREELVTQLAKEFKLPLSATMSDLIACLDEAIAPKLIELREEFVGLVEQLIKLSHGNQLMLQAGLVRVDATFNYLASLATPTHGNYTVGGPKNSPPRATTGNVLNWEV